MIAAARTRLRGEGGTRVVEQTDAALARACLTGDRKAWDELIARYGRLVYSIPRRYGMSEADADDVFQAVFEILLRRLGTLRDLERLSSWLITITHRECWRLKKRSGPPTADLSDGDALEVDPPADAAERWERQQLVRQALRQLGGPCQALLEALFLRQNELSYDAIARELGTKVGSIGPTRARCFKKLADILRTLGLEPAGVASSS